ELGFDVLGGARDHWQLWRVLAPVNLRFGRVGIVVKGHIELPGQETAAPQLGAQSPLLHQALKHGAAPLGALFDGFPDSHLAYVQGRGETLRVGRNLHAPANSERRRVKVETDGGDLTPR